VLTQEEKWYLDLNGFMVIRDAVPSSEVEEMKAQLLEWYQWEELQFEPPMRINKEPGKPWWVYNMHYGHPAFQRLILNPNILRVATALTWNQPRVFDVLANICYPEADGLHLHGGHKGWFRSPYHQYQVANDQIFASFFNLSVSLVDVPEGNGFACLPGSHKSNFECPERITMNDGPPTVRNVPVNAGDIIIFLPNIRHAGRRWTYPDYPRMTVFLRWVYAEQFHHADSADWLPFDQYKDQIPTELHQLEGRNQGQREALDQLISPHKIEVPDS